MAPVRTKDYGRISVLSQLQCQIDHLLDLNPNCFTPAPKIWSSVLLFRPLPQTLTPQQISKVEKLTTLAFWTTPENDSPEFEICREFRSQMPRAKHPLTARAEELTPQQFLALADLI